MGEFEIELEKVKEWAGKINGYSGELKKQKGRVESISRQLMFRGDYQGVKKALSKIAGNINTQQNQMKQYGGMLGNIVTAYKGAESAILTTVTPSLKIVKAAEDVLDVSLGILSELGVVGSSSATALKLIDSLLDDGLDEKDILKLFKWGDGTVGKLAGMLDKAEKDRDWDNFWFSSSTKSLWDKLDVKASDSISTKWDAYIKDMKDDYSFSAAKTPGGKVKVATKYIGAALSFALTALDNKKEQGGVMTGRAWGETVTETLVSAGEDFLIGSAVAMVMGGAPVVAVGVTTTLVTWGADWLYRKATGSKEGLIEDVSDAICDTAESVGNTVSKWAKSTWNSVNNFFAGGNSRPAYAGGGGVW